jgi:hypothetical protein
LHLSWHLHFEAHTEQHLQAEHGQICRSHPSHEEVWDIYIFSSPRVSKINFLIHVLESFFTTPAMSLSVVLSARVKPSYRIRLNPCLPSLAQRPASCQYDRIDFGQPIWTTSYTSRISNPIPKATVAIMHRIRPLPLLNSVSILSLESWCVLLWYISTKISSACFFLSKYASAPKESLKVKKISETVSIDLHYMMFFLDLIPFKRMWSISHPSDISYSELSLFKIWMNLLGLSGDLYTISVYIYIYIFIG